MAVGVLKMNLQGVSVLDRVKGGDLGGVNMIEGSY